MADSDDDVDTGLPAAVVAVLMVLLGAGAAWLLLMHLAGSGRGGW